MLIFAFVMLIFAFSVNPYLIEGGVKYKSLRRFAWSGLWGPKIQIHPNFWVGTSFKVCNPQEKKC